MTQEGSIIINRVECDTNFDFTTVRMLLLSNEAPCPEKAGYAYVNVVLFTEKPVPLLIPYLFDRLRQPENDLQEWVFINNKLQRARHHVDNMSEL